MVSVGQIYTKYLTFYQILLKLNVLKKVRIRVFQQVSHSNPGGYTKFSVRVTNYDVTLISIFPNLLSRPLFKNFKNKIKYNSFEWAPLSARPLLECLYQSALKRYDSKARFKILLYRPQRIVARIQF